MSLRSLATSLFGVLVLSVVPSLVIPQQPGKPTSRGGPSGGETAPPLVCASGIACDDNVVEVSPHDSAAEAEPSTSGNTVVFVVNNVAGRTLTYNFSCTRSGQVSSCSRSPTSASLAVGASVNVTVTYVTSTIGTGAVALHAQGGGVAIGGIAFDDGLYHVTVATHSVAVTPDGTTGTSRLTSSQGTETFTIQNTGSATNTFTLGCGASGQISGCGFTGGTATLASGASTTRTVSFNTSATPGNGTLTFSATGVLASDGGSITVPVVTFGVAVAPDGGAGTPRALSSQGSETFRVRNSGTGTNRYGLSCGTSGQVSACGLAVDSVTVNAGDSTNVAVTFNTSATVGTGTVRLTASGTNAVDSGTVVVPVIRYGVAVTPDGGSAPAQPANTGSHTQVFAVQNTGSDSAVFALTCAGSAGVTCSGAVSPASVTLAGGASANVTATFAVGALTGVSGSLTVTATSANAQDSGNIGVPIAGTALVLLLDSVPRYTIEDMGKCATNCFAVTHALGTVPYVSLGAPRSLTLAYNSDRVAARPFVYVDVEPSPGASLADELWLEAKVNGAQITFTNGDTKLRFQPSSARVRLGGQFDGSSYSTGVYTLELTVSAKYTSSVVQAAVQRPLIIVNEQGSPIARGWTIAGEQRLRVQTDSSMLLTDGVGSAMIFGTPASGLYATPFGDYTQLRTTSSLPGGGSGYVRAYPDSSKAWFNSQGYMIAAEDGFGTRTTWARDGSNRVSTITDAASQALTLTYDSNGLDYIDDAGSRRTQVTVAANHTLTGWADPDTISTTFGYDGSLRLQTVTDRKGATSTFAYSTVGKVATVTAPSITVFGGSTVQPVTTFAAWQARSVPTTSTASTMATPVRSDSIYGSVTEPGGASTSQMIVNRWGQTWYWLDPRGWGYQMRYTAAGLPMSYQPAEYDGGDTDSTEYVGPALPSWTRKAQTTATMVTYDSTKHWAVRRVEGVGQPTVDNYLNALGLADSVKVDGQLQARYTYDAKGRVLTVVDANGVTMQTNVYTVSASNPTGNLASTTVPGSRVSTYTYDAVGRLIRTIPAMGLRDTTEYDVLNRVTKRTSGTGGTTSVVTYGYDALRLTSVTDPKSLVYSYTYNALGWLTRKADPAGRPDTLRYSPDGDLRQAINRRHQQITYTYDNLHRMTGKSGDSTATESWIYASVPYQRWMVGVSPSSRDSTVVNVRGQPLVEVTTLAGQTFTKRYTYTSAGLADSVVPTGPMGFLTRSYTWNPTRGLLTSITVGSKTTSFGYDANFLPTSVGDMSYTMGSLHAAYSAVNTNSTEATWRGIDIRSDGLIGKQLRYSGDVNAPGLDLSRTYSYDGLRHLTGASELHLQSGSECDSDPDNGFGCALASWNSGTGSLGSAPAGSYSFDAAHNRTDQGATYGSGNDGNRLTNFGSCGYTYDLDGNVLSRGGAGCDSASFAWSAEGRLLRVIAGGYTTDYQYDASGRLVRQDSAGTANRYFLWQGDHLLAELNGTATTKLSEYSYYPGMDRLHIVAVGDTLRTGAQDLLGNVIALFGPAGQLVRSYIYGDWGNLVGGDSTISFGGLDRARWKGALNFNPGGTELYFMRNRWYEPRTGRFLSQDPIGLEGGINLYMFAGGDPVGAADPTGTRCSSIPVTVDKVSAGSIEFCNVELGGFDFTRPGFVDLVGGGGSGGGGDKGDEGDDDEKACKDARNAAVKAGFMDLAVLTGPGLLARGGQVLSLGLEAGAPVIANGFGWVVNGIGKIAGLGVTVPGPRLALSMAGYGAGQALNQHTSWLDFVPVVNSLTKVVDEAVICLGP